MTSGNIRLSRISYPRGTWWVMLSMTIIFIGFGVWAEACMPETTVSADLDSIALTATLPQLGMQLLPW